MEECHRFLYSTFIDRINVFLGVVCGLGFFDFCCFNLVCKIVSCVFHTFYVLMTLVSSAIFMFPILI